jgi:hypothetical protein
VESRRTGVKPLPEWRYWSDIEGVPDDPETGTTALEMAEDTWSAWRDEVVAAWKGPKLLLSDAHRLLDVLFAARKVDGPTWWLPPFHWEVDRRLKGKSEPELAELLWFTVAKFSSFASPAVVILERLQPLIEGRSPSIDAQWYVGMHNLLEALAAEQTYTRDATDLRNKRRGGAKRAQQDRERLAPMLDVAKDMAREVWLANGRKWRRCDNALIEKKTRDRLPDSLKSLAGELTRPRLDAIRKQIAAELPPTEPDKAII